MKRHDVDLVSLISGAVFAIVAAVHLAGAAADEGVDLAWLAPLALVGLGIAGLAGALRGAREEGPPEGGGADAGP